MVRSRANHFGRLIRERRRLLNLTQAELARRIRVSMPFVGHLETGHRRPSEKTIAKLAKVLGLDQQELFLLANPSTRVFFRSHYQDSTGSAWDQFKQNQQLHRALSCLIRTFLRPYLNGWCLEVPHSRSTIGP
jgi:transcriptional regulator with XRE-family HTH domain